FDRPAGELLAHALLAEAGNADHALARRRALGEAGERRPDLSAYAENDDVAGKLLQRGDQRRRRRGHHLLEVLHVAQTIGQRAGGLGHPRVLSSNGRGRERACHDHLDAIGPAVGPARCFAKMALAAKLARTLLHRECDSTVARAPRRRSEGRRRRETIPPPQQPSTPSNTTPNPPLTP